MIMALRSRVDVTFA